MGLSKHDIEQVLEQVCDPEIPVLSIIDLGVLRDISIESDGLIITITPTYSGCPAMKTIEEDIQKVCAENHFLLKEVKTVLSPAWTTDWLSASGREKLKAYGIAPPANESDKSVLFGKKVIVACPKCNSENTKMISQFGSTSCKALFQCLDCQEPFEYFKCLK